MSKFRMFEIEVVNWVVETAKNLFSSVGMQINQYKSVLINIENGILVPKNLALLNGDLIPPVSVSDTIKYLGVNFNDEIIW